jgi:Glycosyltransferase family 87/WD40-like Beta Propeller Repeat
MTAPSLIQRESQQRSLSTSVLDCPREPVRERVLERVLLITLLTAFAYTGFIPAWRHLNSDFPNYYLVARLWRSGYPINRVYDWISFQREKDHAGIPQGLVSFIPSTLLSALPLAPLSSLPPMQAKHVWLLSNLAFLLLAIFVLTRLTFLGWQKATVLTLLAFIPLRNNFLFGQMHVLVLLLLCLSAWLFFRGSSMPAGMTLGLAAALKIYPAFFVLFFVWKKQWRAALGIVLSLAVVSAISLYAFGVSACLTYVLDVLPAALRGETLDPYAPAWNSIDTLLRRLFVCEPELNPYPVAHVPWLYSLLQPFVHSLLLIGFMWVLGFRACNKERTKIEWAAFLFLLLFLSSQPGSYHFVALILTTALLIDHLLATKQRTLAACALIIYLLICGPIIHFPGVNPVRWQNLLYFSRLAFMAVLGGMLLWTLSRFPERIFKFTVKNVFGTGLIFVVLSGGGFWLNQRHLRGQFDNYAERIATIPGDLLSSEPTIRGNEILFSRMIADGYTISEAGRKGSPNLFHGHGDWLHPTAAGDKAWVEEALPDRSRVLRLATNSNGEAMVLGAEVENAEAPVVSADGTLLAFLRPIAGHNSLWLRALGANPGQGGTAAETEIAGAEYDVAEASFLPNRGIIFSSQRRREFRLYTVANGEQPRQTPLSRCSARYPSASPDGHWLAFSCYEKGVWQVHVKDLWDVRDAQLTHADCSSVAPNWYADSAHLVYASDCGRGLGLTALVKTRVPQ